MDLNLMHVRFKVFLISSFIFAAHIHLTSGKELQKITVCEFFFEIQIVFLSSFGEIMISPRYSLYDWITNISFLFFSFFCVIEVHTNEIGNEQSKNAIDAVRKYLVENPSTRLSTEVLTVEGDKADLKMFLENSELKILNSCSLNYDSYIVKKKRF